MSPIKSLPFDLHHQIFVDTLCFTGINKKIDTVIETAPTLEKPSP